MRELVQNYGDAILAVICGLVIFGIFIGLFLVPGSPMAGMIDKFISYYL